MNFLRFIGGLLLGATVGVVAGLLVAPRSGKRTQKKWLKDSERFKKGLEKDLDKRIVNVKKEINTKLDDYSKTGENLVNNLKESIN